MSQYIINGGHALAGDVFISGAKNAALGILAAAALTEDDVLIENMPDVADTNVMLEALRELGAGIERIDRHSVRISGRTINCVSVDDEYIRKIRASYYLIGALLGRFKEAHVPLPGGCVIGARPIDQHIKGFRALGAEVGIVSGDVAAKAERLTGAHIYLDKVSVGATINIMLAACMASGRTIIENVAKEPHIVDVANFLNSMGASVRGAGTDVIRIDGVERLHGTEYSIIPDQIETGTFMCAAAVTRGDITVRNIIPKHMEAVSAKLREIGCEVVEGSDSIRVVGRNKQNSSNVITQPYPGFPTDMQPQIAAVLALASGTSIVVESIFENRFKYTQELMRMGADISVEGNTAVIKGTGSLSGARVTAPDLRAGAALVIAGFAAAGTTIIDDIEFILRGYESFDAKFRNLGGDITVSGTTSPVREAEYYAG